MYQEYDGKLFFVSIFSLLITSFLFFVKTEHFEPP